MASSVGDTTSRPQNIVSYPRGPSTLSSSSGFPSEHPSITSQVNQYGPYDRFSYPVSSNGTTNMYHVASKVVPTPMVPLRIRNSSISNTPKELPIGSSQNMNKEYIGIEERQLQRPIAENIELHHNEPPKTTISDELENTLNNLNVEKALADHENCFYVGCKKDGCNGVIAVPKNATHGMGFSCQLCMNKQRFCVDCETLYINFRRHKRRGHALYEFQRKKQNCSWFLDYHRSL